MAASCEVAPQANTGSQLQEKKEEGNQGYVPSSQSVIGRQALRKRHLASGLICKDGGLSTPPKKEVMNQ